MLLSFVSNLFDEIRVAARQLRKAPGFTATVLLTLAIGITAATVIFSLVDAVLLRPLAFPEPDRLMTLNTMQLVDHADSSHGAKGAMVPNDTSFPNFYDWRSLNKSFSSMAAYNTGGLVLGASANGPARRLSAAEVSADFFKTVGVMPVLGHDFTRADEVAGARTVVLGNDLWKNEFRSDRAILGRQVVLSDQSYTVIGVMPAGFNFPVSNFETAFWVNDGKEAEGQNPSMKQRGYNQLAVVGRLRSGATVAQAKAEMDAIQSGLAARYADDDAKETAVSVVPQLDDLVEDVRMPLRILFWAVGCLLLIVCANVAGLMLTRASQRRGELAIRSALGARPGQLVRQMLTESLVLSIAGGLLALALSTIALKLLPNVLPANLPRVHTVAMNGEVLGFAVALAIGSGVVFGLLPALRASQQDPSKALGEASRTGLASRRHYRLQSVLVVAQTALGLVLLVSAGLLIRSFDRTLHVDPGFDPQQMLTFRISIPTKRYSEEQQGIFYHEMLSRLEALPGVKSATSAFPLPLAEGDINIGFTIAGQPVKPGDEPSARVSLVEPKYFETLRIPLKQGRFFLASEQSAAGQPVVIVDEAFARRFFPGQNAIGKRMTSGLGIGNPAPEREIVGIVGSVKRTSLTEEDKPTYYIPFEQAPVAPPAVALRLSGDPDRSIKMVRETVAQLDSNLPTYRMQSYANDLARLTAQQRFQTLLLTGFALIALLLSGLGLYAVLSYMLAQRTPELGLRIALGASRSHVLRLMLARGVMLAGVGLVAGIVASVAFTRVLAGLLYRVKALDAATFAVMTLVLFGVAAFASLLPAWRASRLDPNQTLRGN